MTKQEIFDTIVEMIKTQLHQESIQVTPETTLQVDLGVDSIALMEFVIHLEDTFHLAIPDEDVETMETMGQILDYLDQRIH